MVDRYRVNESFEFNKEHGPFEEIADVNAQIKELLGENFGIEADFFGFKTKLPIGVAAGPLYNLRYMLGAAKDGFEVITWKTFRSEDRLAHRNEGDFLGHNIVFVNSELLEKENIGTQITGTNTYEGDPEKISITNSFGMPSATPDKWMPEITAFEKTAKDMHKCVITSIVGSPKEGFTIVDLAKDYAYLAKCAVDAGARIIETNFSCPNVKGGKEGSLFKNPDDAQVVCKHVREAIGPEIKYLVKMGFCEKDEYITFLEKTQEHIDGIVAINTLPMNVVDANGKQALPGGLSSGLCGYPILDMAVQAVKNLVQAKKELHSNIHIFGCGGVTSPQAVLAHLDAGAEFVFVGTAALFHPKLPLEFAQYLHDNKISRKL